jgi:hypothetical protein
MEQGKGAQNYRLMELNQKPYSNEVRTASLARGRKFGLGQFFKEKCINLFGICPILSLDIINKIRVIFTL